MRHESEQLALAFPATWGGKRKGAGRKPKGARPGVAHRARPAHRASEPVHVTLRSAFRPLRSRFVFPTVRRAISDANARARKRGGGLTVAHFSVQFDHLHLIVEAPNRTALLRGIRGLAISIARRVNRLTFRRGPVFPDRWHGRALTTPRAVRHALVYVLANFRKHLPLAEARCTVDPYSSAPHFPHVLESPHAVPTRASPAPAHSPVAPAQTWLLATAWLRHGRLSVHEAPRG
jgi:hypothetical protein